MSCVDNYEIPAKRRKNDGLSSMCARGGEPGDLEKYRAGRQNKRERENRENGERAGSSPRDKCNN